MTSQSGAIVHHSRELEVSLELNRSPAGFDVVFASSSSAGKPGPLDEQVLEYVGIPIRLLDPKDLRKGYTLLDTNERMAIVIVTSGRSGNAEAVLFENLSKAFAANLEQLFGKSIWIPLLGTGASGLSLEKSLSLTLEAIKRQNWGRAAATTSVVITPPPTTEPAFEDLVASVRGGSMSQPASSLEKSGPEKSSLEKSSLEKSSQEKSSHEKSSHEESSRAKKKMDSPTGHSTAVRRIFESATKLAGHVGEESVVSEALLVAMLEDVRRRDKRTGPATAGFIKKELLRGAAGTARYRHAVEGLGGGWKTVLKMMSQASSEAEASGISKQPSKQCNLILERAAAIAEEATGGGTIHLRHLFAAFISRELSNESVAWKLLQELLPGDELSGVRERYFSFVASEFPRDKTDAWRGILLDEPGASPGEEAPTFDSPGRAIGDAPAPVDQLGFETYVDALVGFITADDSETPLTIAIDGEWGSGKSTFMGFLRRRLKKQGYQTTSFNPWRHEDSGAALWAAFILDFIGDLGRDLSFRQRLKAWWKLLELRWAWKGDGKDVVYAAIYLVFLLAFGSTALLLWTDGEGIAKDIAALLPGAPLSGVLRWAFPMGATIAFLAVIGSALAMFRRYGLNPLRSRLDSSLDNPDYGGLRSDINKIHSDFGKIVEAYRVDGRPIVAFVDDLDRCSVPKAGNLLRGLNLLLAGDSKLIVVLGIDRLKVAASLAVEHKAVAEELQKLKPNRGCPTNGSFDFGLEYIEKFIQLAVRVPEPREKELRDLLWPPDSKEGNGADQPSSPTEEDSAPEVGDRGEAPTPDPSNAKPSAGRVHRWIEPVGGSEEPKRSAPDATAVANVSEVRRVEVSERFKTIILDLAPCLGRNPRRMKQFRNHLRLTLYLAQATRLLPVSSESAGTTERLTVERIAKLVVISLRWPLLLVEAERDSGLLARLEQWALEPAGKKPAGGRAKAQPVDPARGWLEEPGLRYLFRVGCVDSAGEVDQKSFRRSSLAKVNVRDFLQVSVASPPAGETATAASHSSGSPEEAAVPLA